MLHSWDLIFPTLFSPQSHCLDFFPLEWSINTEQVQQALQEHGLIRGEERGFSSPFPVVCGVSFPLSQHRQFRGAGGNLGPQPSSPRTTVSPLEQRCLSAVFSDRQVSNFKLGLVDSLASLQLGPAPTREKIRLGRESDLAQGLMLN